MFFNVRIYCFFLLFGLYGQSVCVALESECGSVFKLDRVASPTALSIRKEKDKIFNRSVKKHVIFAGAAVSAAIVLYTAYRVQCMTQEKENDRMRALAEEVVKKEREQAKLPVMVISQADLVKGSATVPAGQAHKMGFFKELKDMALHSSRFFADNACMLTSGIILNGMYQYMQNKIVQAYQDETILWYVAHETQINQIFNDLKNYSIEYDLYASLLSAEIFNQDAQMYMRAFVQDLAQVTRDYATDDLFHDSKYLSFLLSEMKKKYVRQCGELEVLQAYVIPAVGQRHRALANDGKFDDMFISDINRRKDIAQLCQILVHEMERLVTFTIIRFGEKSDRVEMFITSCNQYLDRMEALLNASGEQLVEFSKADRGMFTCSYEFERVFQQQVGHMHRYCKLVA